ncbi:MAG: 6-phosphogluconolactonase [Salaquimonas sp.]|jgi:6-phosphogluconolactonase|nr:6-phosphogluconolactonase [Salaquimonas sp.]
MHVHEYASREQLAEALARGVAAVLAGGVAERGSATLAVSGGSTPALFLAQLSQTDIAWENVTVTLVDERLVPPDHPRSNLGMVKRTLMQDKAAAATLIPLVEEETGSAEAAAELAERRLAGIGQFDALILGMGTDGHTASFFPGGDQLSEALDVASEAGVVTMAASGAGERRLTLTLKPILDAHFLALHIEGEEKKAVLEQALGDGPVEAMPIRAVLRGAGERLNLFWAP